MSGLVTCTLWPRQWHRTPTSSLKAGLKPCKRRRIQVEDRSASPDTCMPSSCTTSASKMRRCRCGRSGAHKENRELHPGVFGGDLPAWGSTRHMPGKVLLKLPMHVLPLQKSAHGRPSGLQGPSATRRGEQERFRKLMDRQGQGAYAYARIFAILQISHELLTLGVTASQRDVYYRHASPARQKHKHTPSMCKNMHCTLVSAKTPACCPYQVTATCNALCG